MNSLLKCLFPLYYLICQLFLITFDFQLHFVAFMCLWSRATDIPKTVTCLYLNLYFLFWLQAWVVERMGKFHRILEPGINVLIPFLDRVKYVQSLKEIAIDVPKQAAITSGKWEYQWMQMVYRNTACILDLLFMVLDIIHDGYWNDCWEFLVNIMLAYCVLIFSEGNVKVLTCIFLSDHLQIMWHWA